MAFVLGGLLGKNVALEGLTALDGTARTHHEALCSTLLGLHLRHDNSIIRWIWVCGRPDGHYPPFETHSTWYADRRQVQMPPAAAFQDTVPICMDTDPKPADTAPDTRH